MERLELLGDSLLKYAVSCHLFLKHPEMTEGPLTSQRTRIISNSALHKFGTDRKLQVPSYSAYMIFLLQGVGLSL